MLRTAGLCTAASSFRTRSSGTPSGRLFTVELPAGRSCINLSEGIQQCRCLHLVRVKNFNKPTWQTPVCVLVRVLLALYVHANTAVPGRCVHSEIDGKNSRQQVSDTATQTDKRSWRAVPSNQCNAMQCNAMSTGRPGGSSGILLV